MGQIVKLRPIGNWPVAESGIINGPIFNRPQVTNLRYIILSGNLGLLSL
jgi:hypothetical protein